MILVHWIQLKMSASFDSMDVNIKASWMLGNESSYIKTTCLSIKSVKLLQLYYFLKHRLFVSALLVSHFMTLWTPRPKCSWSGYTVYTLLYIILQYNTSFVNECRNYDLFKELWFVWSRIMLCYDISRTVVFCVVMLWSEQYALNFSDYMPRFLQWNNMITFIIIYFQFSLITSLWVYLFKDAHNV